MILSTVILSAGITACSGETDHAAGEATNVVAEETESVTATETAVFQAVVLEIQDGSYLVEPVEDGQAVLADSMVFGAYVESAIYPENRIEVPFPAPFGSEEVIQVYAVQAPESVRLVCGARYGLLTCMWKCAMGNRYHKTKNHSG